MSVAMIRLARLTQIVGVNSVPIAGLFVAGWSDGTAIALYWCETVVAVLLVGWRIRRHRLLTNKVGHYTVVEVSHDGGDTFEKKLTTYGKSFMTTACIVLAAEGIVVLMASSGVDFHSLGRALAISAAFLVIGAALDSIGMKERPFAWIRNITQGTLWRVFLIFTAVFGGLFLLTMFNLPRGLFVIFACLKLYTDIALLFPQYGARDDEERKAFERDEMPFTGKPSTTSKVGGRMIFGRRR